MPRVKKLSVEEKARILLLKEQNNSNRAISRKIKCSETSVRNFLKKYSATKSLTRASGSGRKKVTSEREDRILKRLTLQNRFDSAAELRQKLQNAISSSVSLRTVQRRLNELGLKARRPAKKPLLSKNMKQNRLIWCKERRIWTIDDWNNVIFSDESKFNVLGPDGWTSVRRRKGERYSDECLVPTVKKSAGIMVWGCITSRGVGPILFIEGSINMNKYQEIIDEGVIPCIEELSADISEPVFQDDSAPCHRARSVSFRTSEIDVKQKIY